MISNEGGNVLSRFATEEETLKEVSLRPQGFMEFLGQENIVNNIQVMVESSKIRGEAMGHVLFSGPPGLGKTSLSMILAKELNSDLQIISGPAIEKKGDLAAILTNLECGDVLFIDEIHRLPISVEEILYSAMEDFRLDILVGQGPSARTIKIDIEPFTLIGATTRAGLLSKPLRDRFVGQFNFDFYNVLSLQKMILANAPKIKMKIGYDASKKLAGCSRGTPRVANRILSRVRDFGLVRGEDLISLGLLDHALKLMEISEFGLGVMDLKILNCIQENYGGGPVGIEALSATLSEDKQSLEDVYEPFLLKEGYLLRTPRGRMISEKSKTVIESIKCKEKF
ncbi:Holliday junction branch migration DNA helicase RuvB [Bacteriovoracales bacterium]|nr:Holliday junction branch migration DNA helicase RuvB [Bacteriovoracales bacterium]